MPVDTDAPTTCTRCGNAGQLDQWWGRLRTYRWRSTGHSALGAAGRRNGGRSPDGRGWYQDTDEPLLCPVCTDAYILNLDDFIGAQSLTRTPIHQALLALGEFATRIAVGRELRHEPDGENPLIRGAQDLLDEFHDLLQRVGLREKPKPKPTPDPRTAELPMPAGPLAADLFWVPNRNRGAQVLYLRGRPVVEVTNGELYNLRSAQIRDLVVERLQGVADTDGELRARLEVLVNRAFFDTVDMLSMTGAPDIDLEQG